MINKSRKCFRISLLFLGGAMALSCMKYLHSVSGIFLTFVAMGDRRFFEIQFNWSEFVNVTYPILGGKQYRP